MDQLIIRNSSHSHFDIIYRKTFNWYLVASILVLCTINQGQKWCSLSKVLKRIGSSYFGINVDNDINDGQTYKFLFVWLN